jgi:Arc/MetJ family transcription regulator
MPFGSQQCAGVIGTRRVVSAPSCLYCRARYILAAVTKRLIDIDDELLRAAQAALGAGTFKETVRAALEQVIARRGRAGTSTSSLLTDFAAATRDLSDPEVMDAAWR